MRDVAVVLGGSEAVFAEFLVVQELCWRAETTYATFGCNDMIAEFPDALDHAVTLHPDKFYDIWRPARHRAGYPPLTRVWGHRTFQMVRGQMVEWATDATSDLGGSVGLFAIKIAYELGYRKIVLCGVPMTVEAGHFTRKTRWQAAHGFRKGWNKPQVIKFEPSIRSMSGWTKDRFGAPTAEWLQCSL